MTCYEKRAMSRLEFYAEASIGFLFSFFATHFNVGDSDHLQT